MKLARFKSLLLTALLAVQGVQAYAAADRRGCAELFRDIAVKKVEAVSDPFVESLRSDFARFKLINTEDRKAFIQMVESRQPGLYFDAETANLKELNDQVMKDQDLVTAMTNYYKTLLLETVQADPLLKARLAGKYSDFKSLRLRFDQDTPEIRQRLQKVYALVSKDFAAKLDASSLAERYQGIRGISGKPATWHLAGIGSNADEANITARVARAQGGQDAIAVHSFEQVNGALDRQLENAELLRSQIMQQILRQDNGPQIVKVAVEGKPTLTRDAIRVLRKVEPKEPTQEAYIDAVQRAFRKTFNIHLTRDTVLRMRDYVTAVDGFSPAIFIEKRVYLDQGVAHHGGIKIDIVDMNGRNIEATADALASVEKHRVADALAATRLGERKATQNLVLIEKRVSEAADAAFGIGAVTIKRSGDDIAILPAREFTTQEKNRFLSLLSEGGAPGDYRIVFTRSKKLRGQGPMNHVACATCILAKGNCNMCQIDAAGVEKALRSHLEGTFVPTRDLKNVMFSFEFTGAHSLKLVIAGQLDLAAQREIRRFVEEMLKPANFKLDEIVYINKSSRPGISRYQPARQPIFAFQFAAGSL